MTSKVYVDDDLSAANRVAAGWLNAANGAVYPVATLAALKALTVPDGAALVSMRGCVSSGDGGGGLWFYNSASSATANNGTIVAPTTGGGRYFRLFSGPMSLLWFQAVADGVTDNSTAIQAWINALDAGTYHHQGYVPYGSYAFNTAITKTAADGLEIFGEGFGSSFLWTGANAGVMFSFTGAGNGGLRIHDLEFDCDDKATVAVKTAAFGHGLHVYGCLFRDGRSDGSTGAMLDNFVETHNGVIERNWFFSGAAAGLGVNRAGTAGGAQGWRISDNEFQGVNNCAIVGKNVGCWTILSNAFDGQLADTNGVGIQVDQSSEVAIEGNYFENIVGRAVSVNPTTAPGSKGFSGQLRNNRFVICSTATADILITFGVGYIIEGNSFMGENASVLQVTSDAVYVHVGPNKVYTDSVGTEQLIETLTVGTGLLQVSFDYSLYPIQSTANILALVNQADLAAWVTLGTISTGNTPDIPADARAFRVRAEIKCATVGAKLYLADTANGITFANRDTDTRVQFIEALVANRSTVAEFTVTCNTGGLAGLDRLSYTFASGGGADINVKLTVVGYHR